MGKTGKWIKSFLTGKKDKEKEKDKDKVKEKKSVSNHLVAAAPTENTTTPIAITPTTPKEKRRWSFRRSPATGSAPRDSVNSMDPTTATPFPVVVQNVPESENEQKQHAMAMVAATAAVIKLTNAANEKQLAIEEAAAIKIQSVFRSFLARKALCALKGLVKLQALVRGHLVRKQATDTLRCMQALVTVQARARAQRINMTENSPPLGQRQSVYRRSPQDNHLRHSCDEMDRGMEENIKIVEMDLGESRGNAHSRHSYSNHTQSERGDPRFSAYYPPQRPHLKQDYQHQFSPAQSAVTDMSPRTCSGHFEEYSFATTQSSPQYYSAVSRPDPSRVPFAFPRPEYAESISQDYTFCPNYMANTESFKAKVRSQSAPKQRPDSYERQPSRRRPSIEGRNVPRAVRMQRSSSHVGSAVQGYQYSGSVKLDKSSVSLKDSECGSTSTMLTNTNYCRSLVTFEPHRIRYQQWQALMAAFGTPHPSPNRLNGPTHEGGDWNG